MGQNGLVNPERVPTRERAGRLLLLALSILLTLGMGELLLRALGLHGFTVGQLDRLVEFDDPIVDFRLEPDSSWFSKGLLYRTNSRGFRDAEYTISKPAGTRRIVVVGDSVTAGHGVEGDTIYSKQLERLLNGEPGAAVLYEVPTLALGALNVTQSVHLARVEAVRYQPDVLVLGYVLNDPDFPSSLQRKRASPKARSRLVRFKHRVGSSSLVFHSYRLAQRLAWRLRVAAGNEQTAEYVRRDYFTRVHTDPRSWARVVQAFAELGASANERQLPVVVAIFPILHRLDDYPWASVHALIAAEAERNGFIVLDLLPSFRRHRAHELQVASADHVHPNTLGHRLAAEALRDLLAERRLTGPP